MKYEKRKLVHEYCEHFGCESAAYDAEPNRNVIATALREKVIPFKFILVKVLYTSIWHNEIMRFSKVQLLIAPIKYCKYFILLTFFN